jgi:hypothetical protein
MKRKIPEHIEAELHRMIAEGMPADQIAFMLRLDQGVVEEAVNSTKKQPAQKAG